MIKIEISGALYNAGIVGLCNFLSHTKATQGKDYKYEKDVLEVSEEWFLNTDIANLYLDYLVEIYGENKSVNVLHKKQVAELDEKQFDACYKYFCNKTPRSVCELLKGRNLISQDITLDNFDSKKKTKEEMQCELNAVKEIFNAYPILHKYLLLADIAMKDLKNFYSNFAFLKVSQGNHMINSTMLFDEAINKQFVDLLREQIKQDENKKATGTCFQCTSSYHDSKLEVEATYLNDIVADMNKKKSVFWNKNADSCLCPVCNFVYSFMPFGFFAIGFDKVFINFNDSIGSLVKTVNTIRANKLDTKLGVLNEIVLQQLEIKAEKETKSNIEVIIRENREKRSFYSYSIIGKDIVKVINGCKKEFNSLIKSFVIKDESGKGYINIFSEVINNVLTYSNQWNLLYRLLKLGYSFAPILMAILKIQTYQFRLEENMYMEDHKEQVGKAKDAGKKLYTHFCDNFGGKEEADKKLIGYIYKLINAIGTGNLDVFLDTIVRMYAGIRMAVPDIMINLFNSDDDFKEIGYAYIFGLRPIEKKENNNEENKG